ncbi:alpha/beta fold hydrolase [Actinoplanes friuliensis]|uniref:Hydrolase or acyltransferase (Alpha/beta hydrolase superfamily) protein n=1 Tax=Actinoplanes friuliensis DSM 7358 TaxID=1246995 RepID=U5W2T8_9ACTN|nr:alpha/beta hydrolase [Actinoplanes friuliensis]AGZ43444.1 hydrolase or acyltransferase (alpha/beta hydrolase superfamily) protein [Actinoplanes friuliensis DSM 7358]
MQLADEVHGEGRPIVCLPYFSLAATVTAAALEPVFAGRSGWQRHYLDLPGHGAAPPGPGTAAEIVDLIAGRIEAPRFHLAGFSGGGYLAAALTRRFPDRVAGLLLVVHGVRFRKEERDLPPDNREPAPEGWLTGVEDTLHGHLSEAIGHRTPEVAARVAAVVGPRLSRSQDYLETLRDKGFPLPDELSPLEYDGSALVITGRDDLVCGYTDQYTAMARYPRGTFAAVAGAGHYLPFERPEVFTGLVGGWLDAQR